jgi:archaeosine synthase
MHFSVKKRGGPARVGEISINNKRVITPNILFVDTARFKAPNIADILIANNKRKRDKPTLQISKQFVYPKDLPKNLHLSAIKQFKKENKNYYVIPGSKDTIDSTIKDNLALIFVVTNAYQLLQQPKNFTDFNVELREKIGYEKLIYLPSIGEPANFALLSYLGVDFFDSVSAILAARNGTLLFSNRKYNKNDLQELPCNCPTCNKFEKKPSDMGFQNILNHNYFVMLSEIKHVRNAINRGDLRGLVETRVKADPNLTAILRNLDTNHYNYLEKRTPMTSKSKLLATTKESLIRPEIKRFQKRVKDRYRKPNSAKILLLLPCSAKKPYSFSKSHKLFREKLNSSGNPFIVHELIVTSPMGLVPRELELVHPASSYDIPVTGIWDEDEKKMIRKLLTEYLKNNQYDKIIAHLPKDLMEFIQDILEKPEKTCINNSTSKESLDRLSTVLKKNVKDYEKVKPQERSREDIMGLASYQFGKKIAEKLLKNCIIKGKYPYQKIIHNNIQLGMITKERGLISLTINGAERIAKSKRYWVEIYDDFTLKGSVFTPGVKNADEEIRVGDEVIVTKNNKLCAVGVAQMNGDEINKSSHGEAVKVRHRI